jgi:hypothetical protein
LEIWQCQSDLAAVEKLCTQGIEVNRIAAIYLVMVVALAGGLWAVLAIGSTLHAPVDLAGRWELSPSNAPGRFGTEMTIEQSGEFFQIYFDRGPRLDLKLKEQKPNHILLVSSDYQLILTGSEDQKHLIINGPGGGDWTIKRLSRQFPQDVSPPTASAVSAVSMEGH